ncbi:MAG: ATP-grasp domain-containing protein [Balneolaceae bacterium]
MDFKNSGKDKKEHFALVLGEMGLVKSLGEAGIPVFVGSEMKENITIHSRYARRRFIFSSYDSGKFIDELCELGESFKKKPVIFSDDDRALLNISRNREKLEEYYLFLYPEKEMVNAVLDKDKFAELSERVGLPVPRSYRVTPKSNFHAVASRVTFPCIIKPTQRHFWWGSEFTEKIGDYKKAFKCVDYEELEEMYQKISQINPGVIIQEYIEGDDDRHYSANLLVDSGGKLLGHYIARKKRIYPIKAGTGTYVETLANNDVLQTCLKVIDQLELKGLLNIQFKQDRRTGEYKLLEIHARNSLWSILGAKAGANLAYYYYRYMVSGLSDEKPVEATPNVKYINLPKDLRALRQYQSEGILTFGEWCSSLKGKRVFAVLSVKDPAPTLFLIWYYTTNKMKIPRVKRIWENQWKSDGPVRSTFFSAKKLFSR